MEEKGFARTEFPTAIRSGLGPRGPAMTVHPFVLIRVLRRVR